VIVVGPTRWKAAKLGPFQVPGHVTRELTAGQVRAALWRSERCRAWFKLQLKMGSFRHLYLLRGRALLPRTAGVGAELALPDGAGAVRRMLGVWPWRVKGDFFDCRGKPQSDEATKGLPITN